MGLPDHWDEIPEIENDDYKAGEDFHSDVANLLAVLNRYIANEIKSDELLEAMETVEIWFEEQEQDPRKMGWVGRNGLP